MRVILGSSPLLSCTREEGFRSLDLTLQFTGVCVCRLRLL